MTKLPPKPRERKGIVFISDAVLCGMLTMTILIGASMALWAENPNTLHYDLQKHATTISALLLKSTYEPKTYTVIDYNLIQQWIAADDLGLSRKEIADGIFKIIVRYGAQFEGVRGKITLFKEVAGATSPVDDFNRDLGEKGRYLIGVPDEPGPAAKMVVYHYAPVMYYKGVFYFIEVVVWQN